MRVRTFKPQFAPLVAAGTKRQTIRPTPKGRWPQAGDHESWREWTSRPYNSPQRELAQVEITSVERLKIIDSGKMFSVYLLDRPFNGGLMSKSEWEALAKADGFNSWAELLLWFQLTHGFPFDGIVIHAKTL